MHTESFIKQAPEFLRKRWHVEGEDRLTNKATAHLGERFALSTKLWLIQPLGTTVVTEQDMDAVAYLVIQHGYQYSPRAYSAEA